MTKLHQILIALFVVVSTLFVSNTTVFAQSCSEQYQCDSKKGDLNAYLPCITDKKVCLEDKLKEVQSRKSTLTNEINIINGKINIQQLQIKQTLTEIRKLEAEIHVLDQQIDNLNYSLDRLTTQLLERVRKQYTQRKITPFTFMVAAKNLEGFLRGREYLERAGEQTASLMSQAEAQRLNFDQQKDKKEIVQEELEQKNAALEAQKLVLSNQKAAQSQLLQQTKNSEAQYQKQLAAALSEFQSIQAIIAGSGSETKVGGVSSGDKIASIIPGASCNSSGGHVHFIVSKNGVSQNPFNFLKSGVNYVNCSGAGCNAAGGDPFNPSGEWPWPISESIKMFQGYGSTWAVNNTWVGKIYNFHNGLDIVSSSGDLSVRAVVDGELYRGSYTGTGGCRLPYVRVDHGDGISTFYLHVNY